jgi:hypothetical protein
MDGQDSSASSADPADSSLRVTQVPRVADTPVTPHERASIARCFTAIHAALLTEVDAEAREVLRIAIANMADLANLDVRRGYRALHLDEMVGQLDRFIADLQRGQA